jgi:hypothetical protein
VRRGEPMIATSRSSRPSRFTSHHLMTAAAAAEWQ